MGTQHLLSRTTTHGTRRQTCSTLTTQLEQDSATLLTQIMDCQQLSSMQEKTSTASSLSSSHSTLSISQMTSMFLENLMLESGCQQLLARLTLKIQLRISKSTSRVLALATASCLLQTLLSMVMSFTRWVWLMAPPEMNACPWKHSCKIMQLTANGSRPGLHGATIWAWPTQPWDAPTTMTLASASFLLRKTTMPSTCNTTQQGRPSMLETFASTARVVLCTTACLMTS